MVSLAGESCHKGRVFSGREGAGDDKVLCLNDELPEQPQLDMLKTFHPIPVIAEMCAFVAHHLLPIMRPIVLSLLPPLS